MKTEAIVRAAESLYPKITDSLADQSSKTYNDGQWNLKQLTHWRNEDLPTLLKLRYQENRCRLTREELILLMDWKLAMGKFRPMLPKLIKSNTDEIVESATEEGLGTFLQYSEQFNEKDFWTEGTLEEYLAVTKQALNQLASLKGVGPATASLILSLLSKVTPLAPPFFSDEAFLYFVVDSSRPDTAIKYNVKEYIEEYLPVFLSIKKSLAVEASMIQLEKGGWALKMLDMYRIDKLADIEVDESFDATVFNHYEDSAAKKLDLGPIKASEPKRKKQKRK